MKLYFPDSNQPIPTIGGKAKNLAALGSIAEIPSWCVLGAEQCMHFLHISGIEEEIRSSLAGITSESIKTVAAKISDLIDTKPFPRDLIDEIESALVRLNGSSFSVRSSSADEDGGTYSFAGIHESYLWVEGVDSVIDAIKKVWISGFSERAIEYRQSHNLSLFPVKMAVIIQSMVDSLSSGVVFTINPVTNAVHEMTISSLWGLGEGLVSAGLESDTFIYSKSDHSFSAEIATKEFLIERSTDSGVSQNSVAPSLGVLPSLTDQQVREIAALSLKIERHFNRPQDIEFAVDRLGKLWILQSRSITTAVEYGPAAGNRQVWDNSNIIESYSGVTSPMTFSFIRNAYAVVYHCFSEVMGISRAAIESNQQVYRNMLGLFRGNVYYNLINWYRLVKQFPGYEYNKEFMESMMGVKFRDDAPVTAGNSGSIRKWFVEFPKLLLLVSSLLKRFGELKKSVPAFHAHFDHFYGQWESIDYRSKASYETLAIYRDMEQKLLKNWKVPIINDFYVMVFYGILKKLCVNWCGDSHGALQNNLICGEGDIISTEPTRLLMTSARSIKSDPFLRQRFLEDSADKLLDQTAIDPRFASVRTMVETYLKKFGFRCMNELKLEEPSLHETPAFVYQLLANYVAMDDTALDTDLMRQRELAIRREAELHAFEPLSPLRKMIFSFVLRQARAGVKNRENLRFCRTKIYGTLRVMLLAIGDQFTEEGVLDCRDDIFYLTIDEVADFIGGTSVSVDLKGIAALRNIEYDRYRSESQPDEHFETFGTAYVKNLFKNRTASEIAEPLPGTLVGVPCSPGIVRGIVKVVRTPAEAGKLQGEILVASRTDPGWVPLYASVSALLIERGSILSHSAIVAREMGIPAIVGIPNLMEKLRDGMEVELNGTSGVVKFF